MESIMIGKRSAGASYDDCQDGRYLLYGNPIRFTSVVMDPLPLQIIQKVIQLLQLTT